MFYWELLGLWKTIFRFEENGYYIIKGALKRFGKLAAVDKTDFEMLL